MPPPASLLELGCGVGRMTRERLAFAMRVFADEGELRAALGGWRVDRWLDRDRGWFTAVRPRGLNRQDAGVAVARSANSDLLAAALDGGPAAVFVTDPEARFVAANVAACELVGCSLPELLELHVPAIAPIGDEPAVEAMFADLVRDGEQNGLTPIRNRSGSSITLVRYFAQKVDGAPLYVAVVVPRRTIAARSEPPARPRSRDRTRLSTREFEILALLAEGLENEDIARSLHLAPDTVKAHVSKVLQKLGARSRTHAVALALRGGLID